MQESSKASRMPGHEAWHVEDDEVERCLPRTGLVRDYMEYARTTCDAPWWFDLAGLLSLLAVVGGKCDYHAQASNGRYRVEGLQLWNCIVGLSGSGKNEAVKPAVRILRALSNKSVMATDGSLEALHDTLKDREGIGLMLRNEITTLFVQAKRSYSSGLVGWLLEGYDGGPQERTTKAGGSVEIPRVRLSLLGNVPPNTLQQHTTREDWRSGFLTRFLFWGGRKTRYVEIATFEPKVEASFGLQLQKYVFNKDLQVVIPYEIAKTYAEWCRQEIMQAPRELADELRSMLQRLQTKGYQVAALYALARLDHDVTTGGILVDEEDMRCATEVMKLMRRTTEALFNIVGGTTEATLERQILSLVARTPGIRVVDIASAVGISVRHASSICLTYTAQGAILGETVKSSGRGRPPTTYRAAPWVLSEFLADEEETPEE